jgi:glyoxylase-like metal-dependent hydrolase (beta-lactamase superfamily II)/rhodanese-related sulfurtransferase
MILKQFYLDCLAQASYVIGDEHTGTAAVVDPRRDVQLYLEEAERQNLQIRHVFLTHFHADFVAGHLELRDRTGATIYLGASAQAEYPFTPLHDGDVVEFGRVRLQVLETPGHTAESISILVFDLDRDATRPHAVLTGDTLFVGDVGRPDLRASLGWSATELGDRLYHSLWNKLLPLPDDTVVYPGHGAGSLCGKSLGAINFSTIGQERRSNYALQSMSRDDFVSLVTADQPDAPAYFTYDAVLNSKIHPTLESSLQRGMTPLTLARVLELQKSGALVIDVRDPADFARGHLAGGINIGLGGQYATWAGSILDRERPLVIIAPPGREEEAATRLGRIGFDQVVGFLDSGMQSLDERPDLLAATERITVGNLVDELASSTPPVVVDVRRPKEWADAHIEGSVNIPLNHLEERIEELPRDRRLVVHCATGYRSSIAASLLARRGFEHLAELTGGMAAWAQRSSSAAI